MAASEELSPVTQPWEISGIPLDDPEAQKAALDEIFTPITLKSQSHTGDVEVVDPVAAANVAKPEQRGRRLMGLVRNFGKVAVANLRPSKSLPAIAHLGEFAIAATVALPTNEAIRTAIFAAGQTEAHGPAMGALAIGGATALLEAAGVTAAVNLTGTKRGVRVAKVIDSRVKKMAPGKVPPLVKAGSIFLGGSMVGLAIERHEHPEHTRTQNRLHGLFTSAWLGLATVPFGAAAGEGVNLAVANPDIALPSMGGGLVAAGLAYHHGRKLVRKIRRPETTAEVKLEDHDKYASYRLLVSDDPQFESTRKTEQDVWDEKGFGSLEEYQSYIRQSRTLAAFDKKTGNCVGVTRLFTGAEGTLPPVLDPELKRPLPFNDPAKRAELIELARAGKLEELGTTSVTPALRRKGINTRMWRLAYTDAAVRGVSHWAIIMEPERVERMNQKHGFTFEQLGPAVNYQGGDCAAFVMNLEDGANRMHRKHPISHFWFTRKTPKH